MSKNARRKTDSLRAATGRPASPRTWRLLRRLQQFESRNVTYCDPRGGWPIFWDRARGAHVWDAEGRRYLDLTAAFGVMAAGHGNPAVVRAAQRQLGLLVHAMGDVHPHARKADLARELSRITFERWTAGGSTVRAKTLFGNSGFEAVEAALKTAMLATGRPGVVAFAGGYHGLGYGALNATHRAMFREPFRPQLGQFGVHVPFPAHNDDLERVERQVRQLLEQRRIGAILVEPVQGRGGIRVPPAGLLPLLHRLATAHQALLVVDEIYTGFGRTGRWFACEHSGVVPDLICLGKALTGGFPLSACVGRADVMDRAWPVSTGEATHTSTFLGHPVGCAMALAHIAEIRRRRLPERSAALGHKLLAALRELDCSPLGLVAEARGLGLMVGLELRYPDGQPAGDAAMTTVQAMLQRGFILLPEGAHGEVIGFTPPLTIRWPELAATVAALAEVLPAVFRP